MKAEVWVNDPYPDLTGDDTSRVRFVRAREVDRVIQWPSETFRRNGDGSRRSIAPDRFSSSDLRLLRDVVPQSVFAAAAGGGAAAGASGSLTVATAGAG